MPPKLLSRDAKFYCTRFDFLGTRRAIKIEESRQSGGKEKGDEERYKKKRRKGDKRDEEKWTSRYKSSP